MTAPSTTYVDSSTSTLRASAASSASRAARTARNGRNGYGILICQVPYGETSTYGQLARDLGYGTTPQEVGATVGRNPLSILVPCHRVIGSTGKLTGYAGGLRRKQFLLDLELSTVEHPMRLF